MIVSPSAVRVQVTALVRWPEQLLAEQRDQGETVQAAGQGS